MRGDAILYFVEGVLLASKMPHLPHLDGIRAVACAALRSALSSQLKSYSRSRMVREYDLVASYKIFSSSFSDSFGVGQFASRDKLRYPFATSEKKKEQVLATHAPPSARVTGTVHL